MRTVAVSVCALLCALALAATAEAKPRFRITSVDATDATAGTAIHAYVGVRNSGNERKRARLEALLRPEAGGSDILLLRMRTNRLAHVGTYEIFPSLHGAPPGAYALVVCVPKRGNHGPRRCGSDAVNVTTAPRFTPTPGARGLNDPLLPQIGNGGYDAQHYDIDLDYDPAANSFISAKATMTATATQDLSEFSLDFQALPVDKVLVNGAAAVFSQTAAPTALAGGGTQPMKLVVDPASGIANGSAFTVEVDYHGQPRIFTDPDGSQEGWITNTGGSSFVVGEPMGSQAWFPSNNHPSDKATFSTEVTVPSGYTALGVGELDSATDSGGTTTWSWSEDDPTATYLVTASVASTPLPSQFSQSQISLADGRSLPIYDTVATSAVPVIAGIQSLTGQDKAMIDSLAAHYGPYPLDSYGSFWDENPAIGYELEVQTKSHFSSAPVPATTYLHELSHQWWGDSVTPHDWNDVWHNEGWAQLSEWIWGADSGSDPSTPSQHFDSSYAGASASDWSVPPATLDGDPANMFASFPTYERPGMMLEGFREIIGPAAFDDFAKTLQTTFAHGNIDTPQFIDFAKQHSGLSAAQLPRLDDYFQQWLYGTTKPTITPDNF
jgi:hypothetical protein